MQVENQIAGLLSYTISKHIDSKRGNHDKTEARC